MAERFAPTEVDVTEQKGEGSNQTHNQTVTQNKDSSSTDSGRQVTTARGSKTDTEVSSSVVTASTGSKNDVKTEVVTEDAGFKLTFTIKISGGLNAGGASPALP